MKCIHKIIQLETSMLIRVRLVDTHVTWRELKRKIDCLRPYRPCRTREKVIEEGQQAGRKMIDRRVNISFP